MGAALRLNAEPDGDEPLPQGFDEAEGEPQKEALGHDGFGQADMEAYLAAAAQQDDADSRAFKKQVVDDFRDGAKQVGLGGDPTTNQVIDDIASLLGNSEAA